MKTIISIFLLFNIALLPAQVDRSQMPESGPAPEISLGTPKEFTLPNGLQVLVVEDAKLPRVTYSLSIDNPPILEGEKAGVSSLTSSLLGQGSSNMPKEAFYEEIDFMGARLNLSVNGAFAYGLSKYSDRIMELLADAALNPAFNEENLDFEKSKMKENLENTKKDVSFIASRVASALAYSKQHPKGEFSTPETVDQVTLEDVRSFYSNRFVPANAYLIISGDISFEEAKKKVTKYFSKWQKAAPLNLNYTTPRDAQYRQINFVDMPNAVQSEIRVQNLIALRMGDQNYFPALLANYILGGGGDARLFKVLREEKGYTYGAYSGARPSKYGPSVFQAQASVRNEVTDSSVIAFLEVIEDFRKNPVSEKELEIAKAKYSGSFIMSLEDEETIADLALNKKKYNLPDDFYENYLDHIEKVTVEDIHRVAQEMLKPDQMRIVVAGKGSEVLEALENIVFNGKKIPVKYYNALAEPVEKPVYSMEMDEEMSSTQVLERYINAIGGMAKLKEINTMKASASTMIQGMPLELEFIKGNGKYLLDMKLQGNSISKQIYDGNKGYTINQGQKMEATGGLKDELAKMAVIFPELNWLKQEEVSLERVEMVEEKKAYVIKVSENTLAYYDQETGLKIKEQRTTNMENNTIQSTQILGDYREVDGVKLPFSIQNNVGPQTFDLKIKEVIFNEEIPASEFE